MRVAIHQPNYLPYLGFFNKMNTCDIFVIYDDAQFSKGDFHNRNKIRINGGWKWLTVPVVQKKIPINEIEIKTNFTVKGDKWPCSHLKQIIYNYKATPYFDTYIDEIQDIYLMEYTKLLDLNLSLIQFLKKKLGINSEIVLSSELNIKSKSSEKLAEITDTLGGDTYVSGAKGTEYLDKSLFAKKGINVEYQNFQHPKYKQRYDGFEENMSSIDGLFNVGQSIIDIG